MLNIHLKIEAKKVFNTVIVNQLQNINELSRKNTIILIYTLFEKDCFLLPYKVRKLSKRARRNLI